LAVDIAKNIYETTKQLQSLDLALKMVSETELEFAKNQQFVTEVADKWGLEIKSLQQTYTQFYTASKGLLTDNQIKETFEGIAKAGSVMGLSLDTQKNAFYAIDQMMSKGTVTSEELKKQLGNAMPGAIKAAAMAYMELHPQIKSIQEAEKALYEDMKKGAIDSATYVPLIAKNFQILYGIESLNSVHTMQAAQNRLVNSWTEWIRGTTQGGSGLKIIVSLMEALAKNLGTVINILALSATGWLAYKSAILLASLQTKLLTLTTTQAVVATETQTVVTGFQTAAQIANTTATTAATTAWQRFTLALKANALGLAILAIGAAVVIFNHFNKSIEETTSEIKEANNAFITNREIVTKTVIENDKLIDRYEKLSKKIKDVGSFTKLSKEEQLEYNGILADLSKKVPNAITVVDNYGVAISLSTKILKKYNYELKKQLEYKRTIALAKDKELIPELKDDIAKKQEWLDFSLSFQKNGATHEGTKTMEVSVAEQRLALSIAKNELTMAEARIKSMQEQIKAESEEVKNDEVKNKTKERTIELIDKEIEALKKTEPNIKSRKEGLEYQKELNRLQKERAYILGEEEKINTKAHKKESKDKEQHLKDLYDLRMAQLEKDKLILEQGLENEKLTYSEKLDIAFDISIKEMEIAKAKYDEETRLAQKNKTESQKLNKEQNEQEKIADINFWKEKEKLAKDAIKRINDIKYKPQYAGRKLADPEKYGEGVEIISEEQIEGDVEEWNKLQDKKKQAHEKDKQRLKDQIKLFNEFAGDFANKSGFSQTFDNFLKE
ncbi:MAG TPA: hypothetical protein DCM02_03620, partial [Flavobacterium sp.]|nr:hypothetical protein [Flavobacterium sp.]